MSELALQAARKLADAMDALRAEEQRVMTDPLTASIGNLRPLRIALNAARDAFRAADRAASSDGGGKT